MLSNHVKRALKLGQTSIGTWLTTGDSLAAELLATAGFDWIVVDTENTLIDAHALSSSIQAISRYRVAPLVRVAVNTDETIQRAHSSSSERSKVNLRIASPAISRVGKGGMPGPSA